ncbi:hypothetical protein [Halalkalicoccus jeotgali]|uniref:Uncharacterized protein n=1 Tax=Halalkalicoccus jeotgali (strain DSM 18796 / CECT 7217 / JCM 14584 / KCTC 4019 / B3) TaxID=795797 RepID=D8J9A9_HALJB|nr:hypothetical protein [Halalkalicoccus jeotgali]ADJ16378.1 hypothetical protein HacjB3_14995 [Halalkalicoccus jeotgali B3]ELY37112.1 hypothetical protein C497_10223 [Halalkalicoccus jeotgali B3]
MVDDGDVSERELAVLHECQLAIEYLHRAYGNLLAFHHGVGHAMDRFAVAERELRALGYDALADELRDEHLPAGAVGGTWTYELVEAFQSGMLATVEGFERDVREELADGTSHLHERRQQSDWRERAGWGEGNRK